MAVTGGRTQGLTPAEMFLEQQKRAQDNIQQISNQLFEGWKLEKQLNQMKWEKEVSATWDTMKLVMEQTAGGSLREFTTQYEPLARYFLTHLGMDEGSASSVIGAARNSTPTVEQQINMVMAERIGEMAEGGKPSTKAMQGLAEEIAGMAATMEAGGQPAGESVPVTSRTPASSAQQTTPGGGTRTATTGAVQQGTAYRPQTVDAEAYAAQLFPDEYEPVEAWTSKQTDASLTPTTLETERNRYLSEMISRGHRRTYGVSSYKTGGKPTADIPLNQYIDKYGAEVGQNVPEAAAIRGSTDLNPVDLTHRFLEDKFKETLDPGDEVQSLRLRQIALGGMVASGAPEEFINAVKKNPWGYETTALNDRFNTMAVPKDEAELEQWRKVGEGLLGGSSVEARAPVTVTAEVLATSKGVTPTPAQVSAATSALARLEEDAKSVASISDATPASQASAATKRYLYDLDGIKRRYGMGEKAWTAMASKFDTMSVDDYFARFYSSPESIARVESAAATEQARVSAPANYAKAMADLRKAEADELKAWAEIEDLPGKREHETKMKEIDERIANARLGVASVELQKALAGDPDAATKERIAQIGLRIKELELATLEEKQKALGEIGADVASVLFGIPGVKSTFETNLDIYETYPKDKKFATDKEFQKRWRDSADTLNGIVRNSGLEGVLGTSPFKTDVVFDNDKDKAVAYWREQGKKGFEAWWLAVMGGKGAPTGWQPGQSAVPVQQSSSVLGDLSRRASQTPTVDKGAASQENDETKRRLLQGF